MHKRPPIDSYPTLSYVSISHQFINLHDAFRSAGQSVVILIKGYKCIFSNMDLIYLDSKNITSACIHSYQGSKYTGAKGD